MVLSTSHVTWAGNTAQSPVTDNVRMEPRGWSSSVIHAMSIHTQRSQLDLSGLSIGHYSVPCVVPGVSGKYGVTLGFTTLTESTQWNARERVIRPTRGSPKPINPDCPRSEDCNSPHGDPRSVGISPKSPLIRPSSSLQRGHLAISGRTLSLLR